MAGFTRRSVCIVFAMALVVGACAAEEPAATGAPAAPATTAMNMTDDTMDMADGDMTEDFTFGDPMEASPDARVVELVANDDFTYTPNSITIASGELITFRVTNKGNIAHDFTLGDAALQDVHDAEMAEMAGMAMADEPNAFMIQPGETKELTWHFTVPGDILVGCHVPGHYAAGMKVDIIVEG